MWILGVSEWKKGSCASCLQDVSRLFFSNIPTSDTTASCCFPTSDFTSRVCEIVSRTLWTEVMITLLETNRYSWPLKIDALVGRWFGISFSGVLPIFQGQTTAVCFRESVYILTSHGNISPDVPMDCINHSLNFLACSIQQLDKGASWRLVFKAFPSNMVKQGERPLLAISRVMGSPINGLYKWVNRVITLLIGVMTPLITGRETFWMNCSCVCSLFHQLDVQKPTVILPYPSPKFGQPKKHYLAILLVTCFGMVSFKVTNPDLLLQRAKKISAGTSGSPTSPSSPNNGCLFRNPTWATKKKKRPYFPWVILDG